MSPTPRLPPADLISKALRLGLRCESKGDRVYWHDSRVSEGQPVIWFMPAPMERWYFAPADLDAPSASEHESEEEALQAAVEYIEAVGAGGQPTLGPTGLTPDVSPDPVPSRGRRKRVRPRRDRD